MKAGRGIGMCDWNAIRERCSAVALWRFHFDNDRCCWCWWKFFCDSRCSAKWPEFVRKRTIQPSLIAFVTKSSLFDYVFVWYCSFLQMHHSTSSSSVTTGIPISSSYLHDLMQRRWYWRVIIVGASVGKLEPRHYAPSIQNGNVVEKLLLSAELTESLLDPTAPLVEVERTFAISSHRKQTQTHIRLVN